MKKRTVSFILCIFLLVAIFLPATAFADTRNYEGSAQYGFFTGSLTQITDTWTGDHNNYARLGSVNGPAAGYSSWGCAGQNVNNLITYQWEIGKYWWEGRQFDAGRDWADWANPTGSRRSIYLRIQNTYSYGDRIYVKGLFWLDDHILYPT